jgi:hypothetical protein
MAGEGSQPRLHVHGVNHWRSKFWASGDDDESSVASFDDDCEDFVLVKEALKAGISLEQIQQAEAELSTPSSTKEYKSLKEGSNAKKVIDIWVGNQRNRGRPWSGPLPPPCKSPLRTFGDALANARIVSRSHGKSISPMDHRYGTSKPLSSSVSPRHLPLTTVNVESAWPNQIREQQRHD